MLSVFITILPVFLILGAGYVIGRSGYLPDNVADGLNAYALKVGVPVLLFMAMYTLDFSKAFHLEMLISFYAGAFFCFYAGIVLSRMFWGRRPGESVAVGFCAVFSNTLLIGFPIAQLVFGETILAPVFGIIALHASILYTVGMTTMEFARQDGRGVFDTLKAAFSSVIANPLMLGIVAGLICNLIGVNLFEPVERALDMIRLTAIPVSLVGIGIALNRYSISSEFTETLMVCVLALGVHPAIALALSHYVFGLDPLFVQAAVVLAAMPPGMNVYIFASLYNRALNLSASVLVIGNLIAVFSIPLWLLVIRDIG
ncbi:MAG: AEC family transporter [Pseudomonadota bacterium]